MKIPPRGSSFEYEEFGRSHYAQLIINRLKNEVGYYIELIENNPHPSGAGVGFWSGIRMTMPVVEAVADVEGMDITELMGTHLNIPVPKITWAMFRHALIHNDQMQHAKFDNRTINWGLSLNMGTGHIMMHDQIHVDVKSLYNDLLNYLSGVVAEEDSSIVRVPVGFVYSEPPQGIAEELERLRSPD